MKTRTKKGMIMTEVLTALIVLAILSSMGIPKFPESERVDIQSIRDAGPEPVKTLYDEIENASTVGKPLPADSSASHKTSGSGRIFREDGLPTRETRAHGTTIQNGRPIR